jgi:hypothetical protein
MARTQISFYASTPTYRPVLETHGWSEAGETLSRLAARKEWAELPAQISDEMLEQLCVNASPGELARAIKQRYAGLLDRVTLYVPFEPGQDVERWKALVGAFKGE